MLPLFIPPVATGLLLLMLFGRRGPFGSVLENRLGIEIIFTWRAVVLACAVMSFPLLVRAAQVAFDEVNPRLEQIARTLGASEWRVALTISIPLAARGVIAGAVLAFARAMGEFGATVIVAGMIPRKTMTLSLSIYQHVQLGQDAAAFHLLLISIGIVFVTVLCGQLISQTAPCPMSLRLHNIRLPLARFVLEIDTTLDQPITGIFGPSGGGKTSLLDLIAGLRRLLSGSIQLDEVVLSDASARMHLPARLRRVGYVPQDLALFPHLSVRANVLYGHRRNRASEKLFTLEHVSEVMEITPLLTRRIATLSGGEQQRAAFARAILSAPQLLLLDEPMSSLDARLKTRLIPYLRRIRDEFHIPLIYVTHDPSELGALCDEVLILENGRVIRRGPPSAVLDVAVPDLK
jgi:ABC-type molybdate transport system permease subunit/ABC-type lipoprotein export system ATPase subunit